MTRITNQKTALMDGSFIVRNATSKTRSLFSLIGFFFILCCFPFSIFSIERSDLHRNIQEELSQQEKNDLKDFFRYLFASSELGYSLFDDKPMSFCSIPTCAPGISTKENLFKIYKKGSQPLLRGFKAWNKIKHLKTKSAYIFIITEKNGLPDLAFLINKERFVYTFNENIDLFRHVYGSKITAESFLEDFESAKLNIYEFLQQHLLLGVLLGYGRGNAELFQRREMLLAGRNRVPLTTCPEHAPGFLSIEDELSFLNQHLQPTFTGKSLLLAVTPVNFSADPESLETQHLQEHYFSVHRELSKLFSSKNWFQIILNQLCMNADSVEVRNTQEQ